MNVKRFFSVFICFAILMPSVLKAASSCEITSLCVSSGIAGYYASVSKAAFEIVNIVFQDFLDLKARQGKKEAPSENKAGSGSGDKAVIPDAGAYKNFKMNLLPGIPLTFNMTNDVYVSKITGDGGYVFQGWMILLVSLLILSIKKKDDDAVFSNNCAL